MIKIALPDNTPRWFFGALVVILLLVGLVWARPELLSRVMSREATEPMISAQVAYPEGCVAVQILHPDTAISDVRLTIAGSSKSELEKCNPQALRTSHKSDILTVVGLPEARRRPRSRVTLAVRQGRSTIGIKDSELGGVIAGTRCEDEIGRAVLYLAEWGLAVPSTLRLKEIRHGQDGELIDAFCVGLD
jgi:hypothetical protein